MRIKLIILLIVCIPAQIAAEQVTANFVFGTAPSNNLNLQILSTDLFSYKKVSNNVFIAYKKKVPDQPPLPKLKELKRSSSLLFPHAAVYRIPDTTTYSKVKKEIQKRPSILAIKPVFNSGTETVVLSQHLLFTLSPEVSSENFIRSTIGYGFSFSKNDHPVIQPYPAINSISFEPKYDVAHLSRILKINSIVDMATPYSISLEKTATKIPFVSLRSAYYFQQPALVPRDFSLKRPINLVIKSDETADQATDLLPITLPTVDFDEAYLVLVYQGEKASGGFNIQIKDVVSQDNKTYVFIEKTRPGNSCFVSMALTHPYHIVQIPPSDNDVVFISKTVTTDCD